MSNERPKTNEDASGELAAQSDGDRIFIVVACLTVSLAWSAVVGSILLVFPRMAESFQQFGTEMPNITVWALSLPDLIFRFGRLLGTPFLVLAIGLPLAEIKWRQTFPRGRRWPIWSLLLPFVVGAVLGLPVLWCMTNLLHELS